jgi:hypothetical protein
MAWVDDAPLPFDYLTGKVRSAPDTGAPQDNRSFLQAFTDTLGANYRQGNLLASGAANVPMKVENDVRDPAYSAWSEIAGTPYEDHWDSFASSNNADYTAALKRQIDMEGQDRQDIAAAGWAGTFGGIIAGITDPTVLIPGVGVGSKIGTGYRIGRAVLAGAATGAMGVAAQEAGLQATQETRTAQESALNIGIGTVLGGLLGGAAHALLTPAERAVAASGYDRLGGFNPQPSSVGAAAVDKLTREDLSTSGRVSSAVVNATGNLNPVLRSMNRALPEGRLYMRAFLENTIGVKANERGVAVIPGGAAETDARRLFSNYTLLNEERGQIYKEMKKAGINMSEADFNAAVGRAARRADTAEDGNMYVTRAAQALRSKVLQPFGTEGQALNLLDAEGSVKTAASYFPKMRNYDMLIARGSEWKSRVSNWLASDFLPEQFAQQKQRISGEIAKLRQSIDDLQLDAPTRLRTLQDIQKAGEELDINNADNIDLYSQIVEQQGVARKASAAGDTATARTASAEAKRLQEQGGSSLKKYMQQRTDLRRRRREVDTGVAGAELKVEAIRQRLTNLEEDNFRALATLVKRGQVLERITQKWDPEKIQGALDDLTSRFEAEVRKSDRAEEKVRLSIDKMKQKIADRLERLREQEDKLYAQEKAASKKDPSQFPEAGKERIDALRKAVEAEKKQAKLEIAANEKELAMLERLAETQANYSERIGSLHSRMEAMSELDPEARVAEAKAVTEDLVRLRSATSLSRGERAQRMLDRMAQADPEKVRTLVKNKEAKISEFERDFRDRWGARVDEELDNPRFTGHAADLADQYYASVTGRAKAGETLDIPEFATPIERGPMKARTLHVPDELEEDFLHNDVQDVAGRYSRIMAGAIAVKKKLQQLGFKNADDMRRSIQIGYDDLSKQVDAAPDVKSAMDVLGKKPGLLENFKAWAGKENVAVTKERLQTWLNDDMKGLLTDLNASLELNLGTYKMAENNTGTGRLIQRATMFNYTRLSGNFGLSALGDIYNAAFAHGVAPFMREGVAPLLKNLDALAPQIKEAKLAGLISEQINNHRLMSVGEIGDPFAHGTVFDRILRNLSSVATKWNGVALMQDIGEGLNSALTQNRIFKGLASGKDDEFMAKLELGPTERQRIAAQFDKYGTIHDGVQYVANSDMWDDAYAAEAFRNALNKAGGTYVVRPGMGDLPLFARTPLGKALFQFRSFSLAAHQRTFLRLMQEGPAATVRGIVGTTAAGMLISWLAALRSGKEGYDRWRKQAENPGWWIAEGFDRGGFVPLLFEAANTTEKVSGSIFGKTVNPVKTPAGMLFGGAAYGGESSRNIGRSPMSALLGPTFGLLDTIPRAAGGAVNLVTGEDGQKAQQRAALSLLPLVGTMPVAKEALQMLTGDSPYAR